MSVYKQYPPYRLPKVSLASVRLFNSVSLRGTSWNVPFGQGWAAIRLLPATRGFSASGRAAVLVDGVAWELAFTDTQFCRFHPVFAEGDADPESLPPELRCAVAEEMLSQVAEGLQAGLGVPVVIEQVELGAGVAQKADPAQGSLLFSVEFTGGPGQGGESALVSASPVVPADAVGFCEILARLPRRNDGPFAKASGSIPVRVAFRAAETRLLLEEFRTLSLGDIVLVNDWMPATGRAEFGVYLRNRKIIAAACTLSDQKAQLTETPYFLSDTAMDDKNSIEVLLTFDLEERTIPLSDLESLTEGYTFTLSSPARAPVTIRANGKPIAIGRLVDINGKLGVEIVESL